MANATEPTSVLGFTFDPSDPLVVIEYCAATILVNSIIPVPLAATLVAIGTLLFGLISGLAINTAVSVVGAYLGLLATRSVCRPCFLKLLGRHQHKWKALDDALTAEGWTIALLVRLAPVSPMVVSNIVLSLTSISHWTYVWTTAVGIAPSNLPFAYAAQLGAEIANEFPPKDPVMLTMTVVGFVASVLIAYKIGKIGKRLLAKHGIGGQHAGDSMARARDDGRVFAEEAGLAEAEEAEEEAGLGADGGRAAMARGGHCCGDGGRCSRTAEAGVPDAAAAEAGGDDRPLPRMAEMAEVQMPGGALYSSRGSGGGRAGRGFHMLDEEAEGSPATSSTRV